MDFASVATIFGAIAIVVGIVVMRSGERPAGLIITVVGLGSLAVGLILASL